MRYTFSIVIPCRNGFNLTEQLLNDLRKHESDVTEVLVVNDASDDPEVEQGLTFWRESMLLPIEVVELDQSGGFTIASNLGLNMATRGPAEPHIIALISNDVRIHAPFMDTCADILLGARRHLIGNRHITFDSGWNTFDGVTYDYLEGYFLVATSDGWRDLDYFDVAYAPFDMEDIDLSTKAKKKGYRLTSLNSPNIVHLGGGTLGYNPEREAITLRNKEYFKRKWTR